MPWFITLILSLITNLPQIIAVIKDIIALIANIRNPAQRAQAWSDLAGAVSAYRASGDTAGLKSLHEKLSAVGTPPDLVG